MRSGTLAVAVAAAVAFAAVSAIAQTSQVLSVDEYKDVLHNARNSVLKAGARSSIDRNFLPDDWEVHQGDREFHVSTAFLRNGLKDLESAKPEAVPGIRQDLDRKLAALEAECDVLTGINAKAERDRLVEILARREFGKVRGPSIWDRLKQKINEFLFNLLSRILGSEAAPEIGKIIVWVVIIAAVGLLGWWVRRLLVRPADLPTIATQATGLAGKDWRQWLEDARRAARAADYRNAVRCAYWAGVLALEERGVWRSDRARTPREYLRLVKPGDPCRTPLQSLTTLFERTWYAGADATDATYSAASEALERLECR